jgi:type I restriction enzyme, R subunit
VVLFQIGKKRRNEKRRPEDRLFYISLRGDLKPRHWRKRWRSFLAVRSALQKLDVKGGAGRHPSPNFAIEQLLNRAVASTEIVDILEACGFDRPDISVLSEEFLLEMQHMQHKNLAVEALKKLLNGEIKARTRGNVVQNQKFSERLTDAITRYHNRSDDALQVIQELIDMAKDLSAEPNDDMSEAERSFYDALA